jgi:hypothetical protein
MFADTCQITISLVETLRWLEEKKTRIAVHRSSFIVQLVEIRLTHCWKFPQIFSHSPLPSLTAAKYLEQITMANYLLNNSQTMSWPRPWR